MKRRSAPFDQHELCMVNDDGWEAQHFSHFKRLDCERRQELQELGDVHDWEWPLDWGIPPLLRVQGHSSLVGYFRLRDEEHEVGLML